MTRLPICVTWPNDTDASQSMPMWMLAAPLRPGNVQVAPARRAAADEDGVVACASSAFIESTRWPLRKSHAQVEDVADLLVDHLSGRRKRGIWLHMKPPAWVSPSNTVIS
jgi:hypothetical protein